ncbi:MAG: phage portal protein [Oscillospiraceae bacterium]|nr:phage portal protein [Oscillospiraceae bacterium]
MGGRFVRRKSRGHGAQQACRDAGATARIAGSIAPDSRPQVTGRNRNNYTLRQRARVLYMSSTVATAAINTNRTKVIGTGLVLNSTIDREVLGMSAEEAKIWQRRTEAEFRLWAGKKHNCDAIGMNDFAGLQQLGLKSWLLSGDVFPVLKHYKRTPTNPYSLRVHLVEADRVSTPAEYGGGYSVSGFFEGVVPEGKPGAGHKIYDGVEVDENGMVVAYYIRNTYPFEIVVGETKWTRVLVYGERTGLPNILHIMDSERPDQYRGVPYLAPVIETLLQLRRYTESELMAALVQSFFTAWIETGTDNSKIPLNVADPVGVDEAPGDAINIEISEEDGDEGENDYRLGPGTVTHLAPGEKVHFGSPNIPTTGFDAFVKTFCRLIGAALELPYDVLIKEFNSSYSASRGALLESWEAFKMRRKWFVGDFCQPIYEVWLAEAVALGRIKAPGFFDDPLVRAAWCRANWIGPVQGQLDPIKEARAAIMLINSGIKTHSQVTREMSGGDWETNVEQLKRENEMLREARAGGEAAVPKSGERIGNRNGE